MSQVKGDRANALLRQPDFDARESQISSPRRQINWVSSDAKSIHSKGTQANTSTVAQAVSVERKSLKQSQPNPPRQASLPTSSSQ